MLNAEEALAARSGGPNGDNPVTLAERNAINALTAEGRALYAYME
jgi:hypothetical protein